MKYLTILSFILLIPNTILGQSKTVVQKGVLDLREWDFENKELIALEGKWAFYWKQLLTQKAIINTKQKPKYMPVPQSWTTYEQGYPSFGYATYQIKVILPKKFPKKLALKMPTFGTSYKLYIEDKLLKQGGNPSSTLEKASPDYTNHIVYFIPPKHSFHITIQISNYHHLQAGIWETIYLGTIEDIIQKRESILTISFFLIGSFFIMFLYHIGLYILHPKASSALYFGLTSLCVIVRILATEEYLITEAGLFSWQVIIRMEYISLFLMIMFFPIFLRQVFPKDFNKKILKITVILILCFVILDLLLPSPYTKLLISPFHLIIFFMLFYCSYVIILAVIRKRLGAKVVLAGFIVIVLTITNDILYMYAISPIGYIAPYSLFIFMLSQAFLIATRFSIAFKNSRILSKQLDKANQELEFKVKQRTADLQEAVGKLQTRNEELKQSQEEIASQRDAIEQERQKSEQLLLNILPEETARELKNKGQATPKYYELVSVLFTDFKGFTGLAEKLNPQEVIAELNSCFLAFDEICEKYNLEKIKTIGDAYMAAGGIPVANQTNPIEAIKAGLEMQAYMQKWKEEKLSRGLPVWELRLGIHTGPLVAGVVGKKKFAYDIWGDTVNLASRMESSGEIAKVNISGNTYDLVKEHFNCQYRGKIKAKNKGEVDMYFVENTKVIDS